MGLIHSGYHLSHWWCTKLWNNVECILCKGVCSWQRNGFIFVWDSVLLCYFAVLSFVLTERDAYRSWGGMDLHHQLNCPVLNSVQLVPTGKTKTFFVHVWASVFVIILSYFSLHYPKVNPLEFELLLPLCILPNFCTYSIQHNSKFAPLLQQTSSEPLSLLFCAVLCTTVVHNNMQIHMSSFWTWLLV